MGYEIYGLLEVQDDAGAWQPVIITKRIGTAPEEINYIWSCGRNAFHEELVKASTIVNKEHSRELIKILSTYDSDFYLDESEMEEDDFAIHTISLGSLRYIASYSQLVDTPTYLMTTIDVLCDRFNIYQEAKPDTVRFTFFESY